MLAAIRGAGDIATGIALRLYRSKIKVVMTDLEYPTCIRRTVCFSEAIPEGKFKVEDIISVRANTQEEIYTALKNGYIPVVPDETGQIIKKLKPDVLVDAILAKKNLGTSITDAPVVIGVGPGFTAGKDCHAVVETNRGHYLGRVILKGSPQENTGIPGNIGGYTIERIIRAPKSGIFRQVHEIGDIVKENEIVGYVDDVPVKCQISGVLRGILKTGTPVYSGMKSGDVDPRCEKAHCYCASDKALSVGGGVLEACLNLSSLLS